VHHEMMSRAQRNTSDFAARQCLLGTIVELSVVGVKVRLYRMILQQIDVLGV